MQMSKLAGADLAVTLHENEAVFDGSGSGVSVAPLAGKRGSYPRYAILHIVNNAAQNVALSGAQLYVGAVGIGELSGAPAAIPAGEEAIFDAPDHCIAKAMRFGGLLQVVMTATPDSGLADITVTLEPVYVEDL